MILKSGGGGLVATSGKSFWQQTLADGQCTAPFDGIGYRR